MATIAIIKCVQNFESSELNLPNGAHVDLWDCLQILKLFFLNLLFVAIFFRASNKFGTSPASIKIEDLKLLFFSVN